MLDVIAGDVVIDEDELLDDADDTPGDAAGDAGAAAGDAAAKGLKGVPQPAGTKTTFDDDGGVASTAPTGDAGGGAGDAAAGDGEGLRQLSKEELKAAHAEFKEQVGRR